MKGVIKSADATGTASVRALPAQAVHSVPLEVEPDASLTAALDRIAALEAALATATKQNEALRPEIDKALKRGQEIGRTEGLKEANARDAERLKHLEAASRLAMTQFKSALDGMERLALLIARDSLDMLLGMPEFRSEILAHLIRHQVAQVDDASIVEIHVSAQDFQDRVAIDALIAMAGSGELSVTADARLASGDCRMTLKLGQADVGLNQQTEALRHFLTDMAGDLAL